MPATSAGTRKIATVTPRPHRSWLNATSYEYVARTCVQRYIIDLVGRTRQSSDVYLGASPRGSLSLFRAGQARAALLGRDHVLPDDIKTLAVSILGHRIIVSPAARLRELSADRIVQEIVYSAPVPGGDYHAIAEKEKVRVK